MADILIRGIEIPKENDILVFDVWHGKIYARSTANTGTRSYEVVSLPEGHGRMIDADAAAKEAYRSLLECEKYGNEFQKPYEIIRAIETAKTIVPAEGGGEDG